MKALILIGAILVLTSFSVVKEKQMYYFCTSRSMNPDAEKAKVQVLLTDVKPFVAEEGYTKVLATAWLNAVNSRCGNQQGCTSDFNYYPDEASAQKQFENAKNKFSDTSRYIVKIIEFKAK